MKKWKKVIDENFKNCEYIHPLQQKKVFQLVEYLKQNKNINKIIIFGSSVTDKCNIDSDVDIYLELNEDKKSITKYFDFVFDLWTNFTVDQRLYDEILKNGVIVYE